MGLLWTVSLVAAQSLCMSILYRRLLGAGNSAMLPQIASAAIYFGAALGVAIFTEPGHLRPPLTLAVCLLLAGFIPKSGAMQRIIWAGVGNLSLYAAQALAFLMAAAMNLTKQMDKAVFWPDMMWFFLEVLCLLLIVLPLLRLPRIPAVLPSVSAAVGCAAILLLSLAASIGFASAENRGDWQPAALAMTWAASLAVIMYFLYHVEAVSDPEQPPWEVPGPGTNGRSQLEFMRRWRHDEKQHLAVLAELAQTGKITELTQYVATLTGQLESEDPGSGTGSAYCDALLAEKRTACQKNGIEWRVLISEDCGVSQFDGPPLVTILGNAIDNAIESCRRLPDIFPFVEVQFIRQNSMLKISVLNSMQEDYTDDLLWATYKAPDRHGLGLKQIRNAAELLRGFVRISAQHGLFRLDVWLPQPVAAL